MTRLTIDGYGQLELNQCAFRRDGRVVAQYKLDDTIFSKAHPAENGMILGVDMFNGVITNPSSELPIAINYSAEHIHDERATGLKNFNLVPGTYLPRLGYLSVGDIFTTNTISYDESVYTSEEDFIDKLNEGTELYGTFSEDGTIAVSEGEPRGFTLIGKKATMPDGQIAMKFQVIREHSPFNLQDIS